MPNSLFHRPARVYPHPLPTDAIVLVAPQTPPKPQGGAAAWLQYLLPAMGGLTSVLYIFIYPGQKSPLTFVIIGFMLLVSVGGGFLSRGMQNRQIKQQIKAYRTKYMRYLDQQNTRLHTLLQRQEQLDQRLYPAVHTIPAIIAQRESLWERRPHDQDFLMTRIGTGITPLASPVRVDLGSNPLADFDAELLPLAQNLVSRYEHVDDSAVTIPLRTLSSLAMIGKSTQSRQLTAAMLCHIAVAHAPTDVRLMITFSPEATSEWSWLRWLPHNRRIRHLRPPAGQDYEPLSLLASTPEEFQLLFTTQIAPEIERRQKLIADKHHAAQVSLLPHFILVFDQFSQRHPIARHPLIEPLFRDGTTYGITLICLITDRADEPSSLSARIEIAPSGYLTYSESRLGGLRREFVQADAGESMDCEHIARALAPLHMADQGQQSDLSVDMPLLSLLHIAGPDAINIPQMWQPRGREEILRVPIGMGADGEPLLLDFKESSEGGMGPHGLIIGATGSGKSELLRTIVTSLAMTHDPEMLNFMLADFKGGASFADLAALPQAAGMITNLNSDLSLVDRMKASLFGEQERRQQMLRVAGNLDNIRQYHLKRQQQPTMEPMPYLIIIVDEFAELLASRPDFLELFIAIGRVGRSLGMHLLLATQRLSEGRIQGLEGHLRYRICLRTYNAAESNAVIGTPDAYYLPPYPGIGYCKVDATYYRQFKSALVSNPYVAPDAAPTDEIALRHFSALGQLGPRLALGQGQRTATVSRDDLKTDMDVIITHLLADPLRGQRAPVHQVWLPPLPTRITLGAVLNLANIPANNSWHDSTQALLRIPIGVIDRPAEQKQEALMLDFTGAGGHLALVGAPQSGKSTFLQSMMMAFMVTHDPRTIQFYCIDLGGGRLRALEDAPHVGGVCGKGERDKTRRMIRQVRGIIEERELLFRQQHIDSMATYRSRRRAGELAEQPFGDVFLIIDDVAQLQNDFEGIDGELAELLATGLTYGVHVIIATNRWAEVRAKLRDNIGTRLELRLNDPAESEVGKQAALQIVQSPPGRGILKGGSLFQTAMARIDQQANDSFVADVDAVVSFVQRMQAAWQYAPTPPIVLLPDVIPLGTVAAMVPAQLGQVSIGIDEFQLAPVLLDLTTIGPHFLIFGDGESGKTNLLRVWRHGLEQQTTPAMAQLTVVDYRRTQLDAIDSPLLFGYACTPSMLKDCVDKLKAALEPRMLPSGSLTLDDLRKPRQWTGARHYLLIDDYEQIVAPAGNPLAPLADIITQARDIGFHIILARRVAGTSRTAFEAIFQRIKEMGTPGLIMNGEPQEGALLGTQKASLLPAGRGYLVRRNQRTVQVQTTQMLP